MKQCRENKLNCAVWSEQCDLCCNSLIVLCAAAVYVCSNLTTVPKRYEYLKVTYLKNMLLSGGDFSTLL